MMPIAKLPHVLRFVWSHPLSRRHRFARLRRFLAWQIGARLVPGPVVVPFVNDTRLLVGPGMEAATGNVYAGLQEFDEMAFVLHALRPGDLFVDIGANIGTYTLLAASAVGCSVIAAEPVPTAFAQFQDNVQLNGIGQRVEAHCLALGQSDGEVEMTTSLDTRNRVMTDSDLNARRPTVLAPVTTLDCLLKDRRPTLIKIDVEGFEPQVIAGGREALRQPSLLAVVMETNQKVARGKDALSQLDADLQSLGFRAHSYDGRRRCFQPVTSGNRAGANTIYIRSINELKARCQQAPRFRVFDGTV